jgi:hypothetical protein
MRQGRRQNNDNSGTKWLHELPDSTDLTLKLALGQSADNAIICGTLLGIVVH